MNPLSGFGVFLAALDRYLIQRVQTAYDYVWDRFGVYVGTFRAAIFGFAVAEGIVYDLFVLKDGVMTLNWLVHQVIYIGVVYMFTLRHHLGREWNEQNLGKYDRLNLRALSNQGTIGMVMRGLIVTAFGILLTFTDITATPNTIFNMAMMIFWSYSLGACVRDRDESRFKQLRFAPQSGM